MYTSSIEIKKEIIKLKKDKFEFEEEKGVLLEAFKER